MLKPLPLSKAPCFAEVAALLVVAVLWHLLFGFSGFSVFSVAEPSVVALLLSGVLFGISLCVYFAVLRANISEWTNHAAYGFLVGAGTTLAAALSIFMRGPGAFVPVLGGMWALYYFRVLLSSCLVYSLAHSGVIDESCVRRLGFPALLPEKAYALVWIVSMAFPAPTAGSLMGMGTFSLTLLFVIHLLSSRSRVLWSFLSELESSQAEKYLVLPFRWIFLVGLTAITFAFIWITRDIWRLSIAPMYQACLLVLVLWDASASGRKND
jgi:hypothetical protein